MTTMAALLGALPLMLGTGTGSELRHPLGITIVGGLIVSQLLTLFTTPVIYLYFDRLERRVAGLARRAGRRRAGAPAAMNLSAPFIRRPVATTLLTIGIALAGVHRLFQAAGGAAAAGGFSDHLGVGQHARRQPRDHGRDRGDAARAAPRADRRRHRDDLVRARSAPRASPCSSASTATSTAPRATCRRRSTPRAPTCRRRCAATRPTARSIRPTRRS